MSSRSRSERPRGAAVRSLRGRTVRWELVDAKGGRTIYHHTFLRDGGLIYRGASLRGRGSRIRAGQVLCRRLTPEVFVISYLNPPYTLTAFLERPSGRVTGVVSSDRVWMRFRGRWTLRAS